MRGCSRYLQKGRGVYFSVLACLLLSSCWPSRLKTEGSPPLKNCEGYASLRARGSGGVISSRFSFRLELPHRGRVDIFDVVGRLRAALFIEESEAYFVLPTEKAYWQGGRDEIVAKFFSFDMSFREMVFLLTGEWREGERGEEGTTRWRLQEDRKGRVVSGEREGVRFKVRDFFPGTRAPHVLEFSSEGLSATMKVFSLHLNAPHRASLFSLDFTASWTSKTWEEIQELLSRQQP